jgi:hypothetical protein
LSSKLHAVCDGEGHGIVMMRTDDQMNDHKGAVLLLAALPYAKALFGHKDYDSDWFRGARHHPLRPTARPNTAKIKQSKKAPLGREPVR